MKHLMMHEALELLKTFKTPETKSDPCFSQSMGHIT